MKSEYTAHEVAVLLANEYGDDCACNYNRNDEWLPYYCEFSESCCPRPTGVACWQQYLKYYEHRKVLEVQE